MAFHIVTNRCFLACEKVVSVVIQELTPTKKVCAPAKKSKLPQRDGREFIIHISYYPLVAAGGSTNYREEHSIEINIIGEKATHMLYAEIIKEVQEQHPSEGYLDQLVNKMLAGEEFQPEKLEVQDDKDALEEH